MTLPGISFRQALRLGLARGRAVHAIRPEGRAVHPRLRRGAQDHVLHVRLPVRHRRPYQGRQDPLHRGQPRPSGQSRRAVRQGLGRHHAALCAGAAQRAAEARRPARLRRIPGDLLGRGAGDRHRLARRRAPVRPEEARLLHRPRPVAVADRLLGAAVRHAELCRAWRLLLGQHGGGRHHDDRRRVLGVRRARLGPHQAVRDVRRRRGP